MASDDEWTAPIMAEVGPDGNVWVIDWYNFIVQHNPTPAGFKTGKGSAYETPTARQEARPDLSARLRGAGLWPADKTSVEHRQATTPQQLVAALKSDNMQQRLLAQRLLVERGNKRRRPGAGRIGQ